MAKRISIYPEYVEVKLKLPWEVVETLVRDGPTIIKTLSSALNEQKKEAETKSPIKRFELVDAASEDERWLNLYRQADRQIRDLRARESLTDAKASTQVARELRVPYSTLRAVLTRFRRERREKITARRNANVIRMHMLGETATRIGSRLKLNPPTITRILQQDDDLIRALGRYRNIIPYRKTAEALKIEAESKEDPDQCARSLRDEFLRQRRQYHASLSIQFWRRLRRMTGEGIERHSALRVIADPHDFGPDYVATLVAARKRKIRAYLKRRRGQTIVRLMDEGLSQKEIAERFNLSPTTIGNRYNAYLKMHRERPDLYSLHKKESKAQLNKPHAPAPPLEPSALTTFV